MGYDSSKKHRLASEGLSKQISKMKLKLVAKYGPQMREKWARKD